MRAKLALAIWAIAALLATEAPPAQGAEHAPDAACAEPVKANGARPRDYHPILQSCVNDAGARKLATRRMALGAEALLLTVDPDSLATSLERARRWRCVDTNDAAEADTRFMRALKKPEPAPAGPRFSGAARQARPGNARRPGHLGPVDRPSRRRSRLAEATGGQRRAEHRLGQSFLSSPLRQKPPRRANLFTDARGRHRR